MDAEQIKLLLSQFSGLERLLKEWTRGSNKPLEELVTNISLVNGISEKTLESETFIFFFSPDLAVEHWLVVNGSRGDLIVFPCGNKVKLCQVLLDRTEVQYVVKGEAVARQVNGHWQGTDIMLTVFLNTDTDEDLREKAVRACERCRILPRKHRWGIAPTQQLKARGRIITLILN